MQITAVFDSIDEMLGFAGEILKSENAQTADEMREPYGRQIASHFPDANKIQKKETAQDKLEPEKTTTEQKQEGVAPGDVDQDEKTYTLIEVKAKLADLNKAGKKAKVQELISSFGVERLSLIGEEHYAELMQKAGEL